MAKPNSDSRGPNQNENLTAVKPVNRQIFELIGLFSQTLT